MSRPPVFGLPFCRRVHLVDRFIVGVLMLALAGRTIAGEDSPLQYNRDIRPILAANCFRCHGPDKAARQGELRLDNSDAATGNRDGRRAIHPGRPANSELVRRIMSTDGDIRMPPEDSGSVLRVDEIETLRRWIQQGAKYQTHWSFMAPRRPVPPTVQDQSWPKNFIDRFVLARLDREKLKPSREADTTTLIRRVTLDLTGLPPTLSEIDTFERQWRNEPEIAYRQLVDRLLASPRYGERMALGWLDAARYADTNGYFTDNDRTMWPWRDWVIKSFNANMPFDQFTIEQLAGDLLPNASVDQKIASGFNRNHMVNNETGIIEEEFRVEYVVDRVDTTAAVWMGLTLGCARCHDHKYDPVTMRDFYRFFAFFNNVPERGLSGSSGNAAPFLKVPATDQVLEINRLRLKVADAERRFAAAKKQLAAAQTKWELTALDNLRELPNDKLVAHFALDNELLSTAKIGDVERVAGMIGNAVRFKGGACVQFSDRGDFERTDAFSFGAWINASSAGCVLSKTIDAEDMRGFDVTLRKNKAIVNLVHQWNRNAIQITTRSTIPSRQWQHLMVTYDGSSRATGVRVYLDGLLQPVEINRDTLSKSIRNDQPLRLGQRQASASFSGMIDDVRLYAKGLSASEVNRLASSQLVQGIVSRPVAKRSAGQVRKLRKWFLENHADKRLALASSRLETIKSHQTQLLKNVPTTMVMQDSLKRRQSFVLLRGEYDQRGDKVDPGVPTFLDPSAHRTGDAKAAFNNSKGQSNRLDLAQWLVNPSNPLTARVTVNRLWQQLFGVGIVKTVDDLGTQGEWPSHPELLDWLAIEFVESGWNLKHLLRLIVCSATYRQTSAANADRFRADRENRMLARGPRIRLDAETIRDSALAIGGLLVERIGGASVKPYQPDGLWKDVTYDSNSSYAQGTGAALYRRSLYTFWKRQSPPPNLLVFDAPTRETCNVQRSRTNTPLQALVLMNDPTFVEAARTLAERAMLAAETPTSRIVYAFRTATSRWPTIHELQTLLNVFLDQQNAFKQSPSDALKLLTVGESLRNKSLNKTDHAALTTVANIILSLDETITRE
jgi:hypothetical protein